MSKKQITNDWLWILFGIYLRFDACDLSFPVYPGAKHFQRPHGF